MNLTRKAISPVVATALLLVVAVVSVVGFSGWFNEFSSSVFVDVESDVSSSNNLRVEGIYNNNLYLKSEELEDVQIIKIYDSYGNLSCEFERDYNFTINNSKLLAYWSFDKYNTSGIYDESNNNLFAEFKGNMSESNFVKGIKGNAIKFDGYNNFLKILNYDNLKLTSDFSIEMWLLDTYKPYKPSFFFYQENISIGNNNVADLGYTVLELKTTDGENLVYSEQYNNLTGAYWIYDHSRILSKPVNASTHRIEIWDLTDNIILINQTLNTDCYTDNLSYYSYGKLSCLPDSSIKYGSSTFFAKNEHIYQTKIYYLGNVDMNLYRMAFDTYHRTPFSYQEQNIMFPYNGFGVRINTEPSGTVSYTESSEVTYYQNVHLMLVYDVTNNLFSYYKNGILLKNYSNNKSVRTGTSTVRLIGSKSGDLNTRNTFQGTIDELKIWNETFNPNDVLDIYENYFNINMSSSEKISNINLKSCSLNKNEKYNVLVGGQNGLIDMSVISK